MPDATSPAASPYPRLRSLRNLSCQKVGPARLFAQHHSPPLHSKHKAFQGTLRLKLQAHRKFWDGRKKWVTWHLVHGIMTIRSHKQVNIGELAPGHLATYRPFLSVAGFSASPPVGGGGRAGDRWAGDRPLWTNMR